MNTKRAASLLALATAFSIGSLSAHCAAPARAPTAGAAEPCPPPPCASAPARSAALAASASARIAAARKIRPLVQGSWKAGSASLTEYLAASELEFRATRDSGVVGPDLVAAATEYATAAREAVKIARIQQAQATISTAELARVEYTVAEAEYWLEEAKTRR